MGACSSCTKGVPMRVERVSPQPDVNHKNSATHKMGSRKLTARTVHMKPANDLDKYRA